MPTARRSRTIAAPAQQLWEIMRDPHHLPRWWPRVTRVEDVEADAFTEVMRTRKGKFVRADFSVLCDESTLTLTWVQRIEGTPFANVLRSAETELRLTPARSEAVDVAASAFGEPELASAPPANTTSAATEVAIELRQEMARGAPGGGFLGFAPPSRFGGRLVRRAAEATLEEALEGLERIGV